MQTDVDLDSLAQDEVADIIPVMLADYESECRDWTLIASEHWREGRWNRVMDLLERAVSCKSKETFPHSNILKKVQSSMENGEGEGILLLSSTFTQCSLTFTSILPVVRQRSSFKTQVSNVLPPLPELH